MPMVWPSCTTTREVMLRCRKVGLSMPEARGVVVSTSLTCWSTSMVTRPPLLTRGVTSRMTPVGW